MINDIVDLDRGPYWQGLGDVVTLAWLPEIQFATRKEPKRQLLKLLGKTSQDRIGRGIAQAYNRELKDKGRKRRLDYVKDFLKVTQEQRPIVTIPDGAMAWAETRKADILLFPQSANRSRGWPASHWIQLSIDLEKQNIKTLIVLKEMQTDYRHAPRVCKGLELDQVAAMMSNASVVVGNDSFPAHFAGTMGKKTLALLGPTNDSVFAHCPDVECISSHRYCTGCHYSGFFTRACQVSCISLAVLTPEDVMAKIQLMLSK